MLVFAFTPKPIRFNQPINFKSFQYFLNLILSRYTDHSCQSLEPQYTLENYVQLNLGPDHLALGDNTQANQVSIS